MPQHAGRHQPAFNLVEAFGYHTRQLEEDTKEVAVKQAAQIHNERQQATPRLGELIVLYGGVSENGKNRTLSHGERS